MRLSLPLDCAWGCPGSTCSSPVWLDRCSAFSLPVPWLSCSAWCCCNVSISTFSAPTRLEHMCKLFEEFPSLQSSFQGILLSFSWRSRHGTCASREKRNHQVYRNGDMLIHRRTGLYPSSPRGGPSTRSSAFQPGLKFLLASKGVPLKLD